MNGFQEYCQLRTGRLHTARKYTKDLSMIMFGKVGLEKWPLFMWPQARVQLLWLGIVPSLRYHKGPLPCSLCAVPRTLIRSPWLGSHGAKRWTKLLNAVSWQLPVRGNIYRTPLAIPKHVCIAWHNADEQPGPSSGWPYQALISSKPKAILSMTLWILRGSEPVSHPTVSHRPASQLAQWLRPKLLTRLWSE